MEPGLIIMLVSVGLISAGIIAREENSVVLTDYKKTRAVVFRNKLRYSRTSAGSLSEKHFSINLGSSGKGYYHPVVRFTTERGEWITQELAVGYQPALKAGSEIDVLYNPAQPTEVVVDSDFKLKVLPLLLIGLGLLGFFFGLLEFTELIAVLDQLSPIQP